MKRKVVSLIEVKEKRLKIFEREQKEQEQFFEGDMFDMSLAMVQDLVLFLDDEELYVENDPNTIKDLVFILEGIRSLLYRIHGKKYIMHDLINKMIPIENPEEVLNTFLNGVEDDTD